jgi:tetratricopeptide (TPR) repeat protein
MSSEDTNPGLYPGNPSLPPEVRDKILSTFRHTLNLYKESKLDDCLIGCDFILKMDPRFGPARKLLEKSKNPNADVDVAELEALVAGTLTRQERVIAAEPDRLLVRAVESYNARDFDAAAAAAEQVLAVLPGNQDAVEILGKARRKKAAQPQAEAAKQKAIAALQANRMEDARREVDRMKALDPDHPAVALLEPKIAAARPAPASPGQAFGESSEPHIAFDDHATMAISLDDTDFTEPARPPKAAAPPPSFAKAPSFARASEDRSEGKPAAPDSDSLDGLSLDTLSLDAPPSASEVAPPPLAKASSFAKASEDRSKDGPAAPPAAPPGSPADLWGESSAGGIELEPLAGATPAEKPHPLPGVEPSFDLAGGSSDAPAALPPLESIQQTELSPSEREIANILKQGDEAAARGDRQQAIEIWSRIFLIDINNSDAVTRIEKARQGMAEGNRKIADCLKSGREAFEAGDFTLAREKFLQVHEIEQNEPTAKFYLDRIEEELSAPKPVGGGAAEKAASPTEEAAAVPARAARTLQLPFPPKILLPAAVFIVLAGAAVYFGVIRQPGPKAAAPTVAASKAYIDDANTLVRDGKVQEAIAVLEKIPLTDAEYPRAKQLIEQFTKRLASPPPVGGQAASAPGVSDSGTPAGVAPGGPAAAPNAPPDPAQLRAVAEKALTEKRYIDALKNFNLAQSTYRGDPTFSQSMGSAAEKVAELTPALKLFNQGEYDTAIPVLWRILHEDHDNQDAHSYLLRCYYNQGISQLQNGLFPKALQSFNEVLALDPKDAQAQRHRKFAERYQKVDLDLMGRIYVRHLPHRP